MLSLTHRPTRRPCSIVLFAFSKRFEIECLSATRDLAAQYIPVRDLQAACRAIAKRQPDIIVASTRLPYWDKAVLEEHAEAAEVVVEWVSPDYPEDVQTIVQSRVERGAVSPDSARRRG